VLAYRERPCADLESVLGASPREFESRILRQADQARFGILAAARCVTQCHSVVPWTHG